MSEVLVGQNAAAANLKNTVEPLCSSSAAQIIATGDQVAQVSVLPWHTKIKDAQTAYIKHSNAWKAHLQACARDVTEAFKAAPEINGTFLALGPILRAAVPPFPQYDSKGRVDAIMID